MTPQEASEAIEKLLEDNGFSLDTVYDGFVYVIDGKGNRSEIEYL